MAYAYTPAFVAFYRGAPLEEISRELGIPVESLKAKSWQEGWRSLASRLAGQSPIELHPNHEALSRIEKNREANYVQAKGLAEDLNQIVNQLRAGTLRVKKCFQYRGEVVEVEVAPSLADRVSIATYARMVADMSYRALGDHGASGGFATDKRPGDPPPQLQTTIIIPAAVQPRSERSKSQTASTTEPTTPKEVSSE